MRPKEASRTRDKRKHACMTCLLKKINEVFGIHAYSVAYKTDEYLSKVASNMLHSQATVVAKLLRQIANA